MDVLSNALSMLLNASRSRRATVLLPVHAGGDSKRVREVLRLLTNEGYLEGLAPAPTLSKIRNGVVARLKYNARGEPACEH